MDSFTDTEILKIMLVLKTLLDQAHDMLLFSAKHSC